MGFTKEQVQDPEQYVDRLSEEFGLLIESLMIGDEGTAVSAMRTLRDGMGHTAFMFEHRGDPHFDSFHQWSDLGMALGQLDAAMKASNWGTARSRAAKVAVLFPQACSRYRARLAEREHATA